MGNNNSSLSIALNGTQPGMYYAGDIISGEVQFTSAGLTGKMDDFCLLITGEIGHTTMRSARVQNGQINRLISHHNICILKQKIALNQIISSIEKQTSSTINNTANIREEQHTCPFSIRLPAVLPPTLHPKDYPFVRYQLELFIHKKWYSGSTHLQYPLRIYPRVDLCHINNSQHSIKFDTKRKDITIKGVLQRAGLIPGEQTMLSLEISNPNHLLIKCIDVCLVQRYEIEHCRRRLEITRAPVPELYDTDDQHIETTCVLKIPKTIPPSFHFRSKANRSNVYVNVYYDVKLEVKAKGLFSNFDFQIPITIGTELGERSSDVNITTNPTKQMDFNKTDIIESKIDANDDDDNMSTSA